ncbi:fibroblast growth factor-binding protein 3 [Menidia menidia]
MRVLLSALFLLLLLLLTEAKRDKPRPPEAPEAPPTRKPRPPAAGSGELSTRNGHVCTWSTGGEPVSLTVNCSSGVERYWCRFEGRPELCAAYGVRPRRYWQQLLGTLRRRGAACRGHRLLRAKACRGGAARRTHEAGHRYCGEGWNAVCNFFLQFFQG